MKRLAHLKMSATDTFRTIFTELSVGPVDYCLFFIVKYKIVQSKI
jgi:hypothetical protein